MDVTAPVLSQGLQAAHARGLEAHPTIAVPPERFATSVRARVTAFLTASGVEADEGRVAAAVAGALAEDLYLAVACEDRVPGSWEALRAQIEPRLRAAAARRHAPDADALVQDVLGALALEASGVDPRPLLSTYAGQGSLGAFATLLLARRLARDARSPWTKRRRRLERAEGGDDEPRVREVPDVRSRTPAEEAVRRDASERFGEALERAFLSLTPRERLALVLKHGDGRSQVEVARLLGVGAPRVSRLLGAAVDRLRSALAKDAPDAGLPADALVDVLARVLAKGLAIGGDVAAPPGKGAET